MDLVSVTITGADAMICSGDATTQVSFLRQHGALSDMTADAATLASSTGTPAVSVLTKGQVSEKSFPTAVAPVLERPHVRQRPLQPAVQTRKTFGLLGLTKNSVRQSSVRQNSFGARLAGTGVAAGLLLSALRERCPVTTRV